MNPLGDRKETDESGVNRTCDAMVASADASSKNDAGSDSWKTQAIRAEKASLKRSEASLNCKKAEAGLG